ncbi:MAG: hypothetical protein ACYCSS_09710 [Sulfuriferula sp.]
MQRKCEEHTTLFGILRKRYAIILELIGNRPFHYVDLHTRGNKPNIVIDSSYGENYSPIEVRP